MHYGNVAPGRFAFRFGRGNGRNNRERLILSMKNTKISGGYTLVELIVAIGLFALIMMLASGAYFMMISFNRQAQGMATGINNLSFALESMTRSIRTGSEYDCLGSGDCPNGSGSFSFIDSNGISTSYNLAGTSIQKTTDDASNILTDPSVTVSSLMFYAIGTRSTPSDYEQPRVTIIISGTVSSGPGKPPQSFTVETGATMRGSDL